MLSSSFAQTTTTGGVTGGDHRNIPVSVPGDGFTLRGKEAFMTRDGVTTKITTEIVLPNGLRVLPSGTVTLRNGNESVLKEDQILTFEGRFIDIPSAKAAEIVPRAVSRAERREVGISARDGVTISGNDVLITRNGVTDKVTTDLKMPNGALVKPDGTIVLANGRKVMLRPEQLIDLHGVLHEAPIQPNPAGPSPASSSPD